MIIKSFFLWNGFWFKSWLHQTITYYNILFQKKIKQHPIQAMMQFQTQPCKGLLMDMSQDDALIAGTNAQIND